MEYARIENGEVVTIRCYPDTWNPHSPGILAKGYDYRPVERPAADLDPIMEAVTGHTVTVEADRVVIAPVVGPRTIRQAVRDHATNIVGLFGLAEVPVPATFAEAEQALASLPDKTAALEVSTKILAERIALTEDGGTWNDVLLVAQGG